MVFRFCPIHWICSDTCSQARPASLCRQPLRFTCTRACTGQQQPAATELPGFEMAWLCLCPVKTTPVYLGTWLVFRISYYYILPDPAISNSLSMTQSLPFVLRRA